MTFFPCVRPADLLPRHVSQLEIKMSTEKGREEVKDQLKNRNNVTITEVLSFGRVFPNKGSSTVVVEVNNANPVVILLREVVVDELNYFSVRFVSLQIIQNSMCSNKNVATVLVSGFYCGHGKIIRTVVLSVL